MKSIKFLSAIALMAVMASCSEDLPNPPAQGYPEPDGVFENSGLVISQPQAALNLKEINAENTNAVVGKITEMVNFPEGYDLKVDIDVAADNSFNKPVTVNAIVEDSLVTVNPDVLNGAIRKTISKKPDTYNVAMRFTAYAERGNTKMRLGGRDIYFGDYTYNVTTLDAVKVIEENYYLVGNFCDWDISKALKFTNTVAGATQYDNPQFSIKIDVTEQQAQSGYKWMVIPESTFAAKDYSLAAYGVKAAADGLSGVLTATNKQDEAAGVITNNGPMLITINMESETYTVGYALDNLFAFSSKSNALALQTTDYINYSGVAVLSTTFYISDQPDQQKGLLFKQDPNDTPEVDEEKGIKSGKLTTKSDGENLKAPIKSNHFYWVDVNLAALTYKVQNIASIQVIGDGNDWNTETAADLTPSKDFKTWTAKGVKVGTMVKLCINNAWTLNFGGKPVTVVEGGEQQFNLVFNGDNMDSKPGTYDVVVDFSVYPYTMTLK